MCTYVKDLAFICRKRVDLTVGGMETQKRCTQQEKKEEEKLGSVVLWLLGFPRESGQNFWCFALGQESDLI